MEQVYVEQDCTFTHEGRTFESGGAVVTPDYAVGYVKGHEGSISKLGTITDWHGNELGRITWCSATWNAGDGVRMHQVEATINGVRYTGRTQGNGMTWKGKRTAKQPDTRVVAGSMGSAFLPPSHPGNRFEIETDLQRRKENRGSMSLEYAAELGNSDALRLIAEWEANKPALSTRENRLWVKQVQAHFRNCYRGEDSKREWDAGSMHIHGDGRYGSAVCKVSHVFEDWAGVHFIRKYYPEYRPIGPDMRAGCGECGHHLNAHANGEGGECAVIMDMPAYKANQLVGKVDATLLCRCHEFKL